MVEPRTWCSRDYLFRTYFQIS